MVDFKEFLLGANADTEMLLRFSETPQQQQSAGATRKVATTVGCLPIKHQLSPVVRCRSNLLLTLA